MQLGSPRSARVGASDHVGQRTLGDHMVAAAGGSEGACEWTRSKDQFVVGREWIDFRIDLVDIEFVRQAARSNIESRVFHIGGLPGHGPGRQVDTKNCPAIAVHAYAPSKADLNLPASSLFRERVEMLSSTNSNAWLGQNCTQAGSPSQVSHLRMDSVTLSYTALPNGHAIVHMRQPIHFSREYSTSVVPLARCSAPVGHTFTHEAESHCWHIMGTEKPSRSQLYTWIRVAVGRN